MRETDELLPTTTARIVDAPKARPRALALTLAVALCAASAIAGVAIPRSSGDGVAAVASSLKADAAPVTDASKGVADRFAPPALKPAAVPKTVKKSEHGATSLAAVTKSELVHKVDPAAWARECLQPFQLFNLNGLFSNHDRGDGHGPRRGGPGGVELALFRVCVKYTASYMSSRSLVSYTASFIGRSFCALAAGAVKITR